MTNLLDTYIPKFLVTLKNKANDDLIFVSSSNLSSNGDVYVLDTRTVSPNVIPTAESLSNIRPELSNVYPYKVTASLDVDGSTIVYVPTLEQEPTASQYYYAPLYFERYKLNTVRAVDGSFTELTTITVANVPSDVVPPGVNV